jgi:hypothetical protein
MSFSNLYLSAGSPLAKGGVLNAVSFVQKNQKIEPQMDRMDADGQREKPILICVLDLCLSCSSAVKKILI